MGNTDRVVDFILKNYKTLSPTKIHAMADVIKSLGGEIEKEPNQVPEADIDPNLVDADAPLDMGKVAGLELNGQKRKIKIYSN